MKVFHKSCLLNVLFPWLCSTYLKFNVYIYIQGCYQNLKNEFKVIQGHFGNFTSFFEVIFVFFEVIFLRIIYQNKSEFGLPQVVQSSDPKWQYQGPPKSNDKPHK